MCLRRYFFVSTCIIIELSQLFGIAFAHLELHNYRAMVQYSMPTRLGLYLKEDGSCISIPECFVIRSAV